MKNVFIKLGSLSGSSARRRASSETGYGPASPEGSNSTRGSVLEQQLAVLRASEASRKAREERLASLEPFCIDATLMDCMGSNSMPLEDKLRAFKLVKQCGLHNIIVAAFVKDQTPDLRFLQALRSQRLIDEGCFASSELFDAHGSELPGQDLPFGLARMLEFGIQNAILECDLAAPYIDWDKYSVDDFCALVESRCRWVAANLVSGRVQPPACWVRLRDWQAAMQAAPSRVLALVGHLGSLERGVRPRGLLLHVTGRQLPSTAAAWLAALRSTMEQGQQAGQGQQVGGTPPPPPPLLLLDVSASGGSSGSGGSAGGGRRGSSSSGGGGGGDLPAPRAPAPSVAGATTAAAAVAVAAVECLAEGASGLVAPLLLLPAPATAAAAADAATSCSSPSVSSPTSAPSGAGSCSLLHVLTLLPQPPLASSGGGAEPPPPPPPPHPQQQQRLPPLPQLQAAAEQLESLLLLLQGQHLPPPPPQQQPQQPQQHAAAAQGSLHASGPQAPGSRQPSSAPGSPPQKQERPQQRQPLILGHA